VSGAVGSPSAGMASPSETGEGEPGQQARHDDGLSADQAQQPHEVAWALRWLLAREPRVPPYAPLTVTDSLLIVEYGIAADRWVSVGVAGNVNGGEAAAWFSLLRANARSARRPAESSALHNFARSEPTKEAHRRAMNRSGGLQRSGASDQRKRAEAGSYRSPPPGGPIRGGLEGPRNRSRDVLEGPSELHFE
jgi:hypothetical protein